MTVTDCVKNAVASASHSPQIRHLDRSGCQGRVILTGITLKLSLFSSASDMAAFSGPPAEKGEVGESSLPSMLEVVDAAGALIVSRGWFETPESEKEERGPLPAWPMLGRDFLCGITGAQISNLPREL